MFYGTVATLFFTAMTTLTCPFQQLFIFLAFFEFAVVALYVCKSRFLQVLHFQYQSVAYCVPIFLFVTSIYYEFYPKETHEFLESFNFKIVKDFIEEIPIFFPSALWFLWTTRLFHTHTVLVRLNTEYRLDDPKSHDLGPIRQSSFHSSLNIAAITFFSILAYSGNESIENICFWIAIFELIMTVTYVFNNSWIMMIHFVGQAIVFSVIFFLLCCLLAYEYSPVAALEFLDSYGLVQVKSYVVRSPFFVASALSAVWFSRMMATHVFLVEVATDTRIHRHQMSNHFNRLIQNI